MSVLHSFGCQLQVEMVKMREGELMAVSVIKLNSTLEAIGLEFDWSQAPEWSIICPNPSVADAYRSLIANSNLDVEISTTTIAKFLSDLFKESFPEKTVSRKADLITILATLWKMKFEGEDPSLFHQAFELFTDLRSFTLDKSLMEDLLKHYPEIIRESVITFWLVLENQGIIDEHQAYADLIEELAAPDSQKQFEQGFLFLGFTHLSANQIELLKVIGKTSEVLIPVNKGVIDSALSTDWVDWILTQADHVVESSYERETVAFETMFFSKGRGNGVLAAALRDSPGDILLGKKTLQFKNVLEIPNRDFFFKSSLNLFSGVEKKIKQHFMQTLFKEDEEKVGLEYLSSCINEMVINLERKRIDDFVAIKYLSMFSSVVKDYVDLSEQNELLGPFDLKILFDVVKLNLPRNFNLPLLQDFGFSLLGLGDLYQVDIHKVSYLYVSSDHDLAVGGVSDYPKEVQELLISLGPIRRQALDLSFYLHHIKDLLTAGSLKLIIEDGLKEHDQVWSSLLEELSWSDISKNGLVNVKEENSLIDISLIKAHRIKKLSATRFQTFVECPAKYYYTYIDKINLEPEKQETLDPRHLGEAQHAVVQDYLDQYFELEVEKLDLLVGKYLEKYLPEVIRENKRLYQEAYAETFYYSKQTIEEFLKVKKIDPAVIFEFEVPIDDERANGSIDVLVTSEKLGTMVFDLKRSGGSIPDKYKFQGMKSTQLWFYLNFLKKDYSSFGYVNLSDLADSLVYYNDPNVEDQLQELNFLKDVKSQKLKLEFEEYLQIFRSKFDEVYAAINSDEELVPNPIAVDACKFCSGRLVCLKGETL